MLNTLQDKLCLVTGGNKGIGLAIAQALVNAGSQVAICGRGQSALDAAAKALGPKSLAVRCDVRNYSEVQAMFARIVERFGGLDILVNNAGLGIFASVSELTAEQWCTVIETNLNGPFYCSREAIPLMRKRGGGYIINISSLAGKNAFAGAAAYNASKFGLNGFSEALMLDVRYDNIRVSYIMPGSVETGFGHSSGPADWKLQAADIAAMTIDLAYVTRPGLSQPRGNASVKASAEMRESISAPGGMSRNVTHLSPSTALLSA
jgi:3-oxoacyl-[acyl-carrier protein] reductase